MKEYLLSPFALGFYVGCGLLLIALYHHTKLKFEHGRYRRMLSDKLEIEASTMSKMKQEADALKKENENLRIKVQTLNEVPDHKLSRDLEVFARAEKKMMVGAPGFAGSWEQAKQSSFQEIADEEAGKAAPKRFFQRFFGGNAATAETIKSLPSGGEPTKTEGGA
jgi:hypothetical protein